MAILAALPSGRNLFSSLPTTAPPPPSSSSTDSHSTPPPPIPIPRYPPPLKSQKRQSHPNTSSNSRTHPKTPKDSPAFKTSHRNSNYYKPIKPGQVLSPPSTSSTIDRSVVIGESGVSYRLPGAPFEFSFSYSETPKAQPLALREPAFLPFAPPSMPRPWTGKAPLKKKKTRKIKLFKPLGYTDDDDDNGEEEDSKENFEKYYEMLKAYELGKVKLRPRDEVLGQPLSRVEIRELLRPLLSSNKQVNLGRDGLTHNMLELIHTHWRRRPVCKVRCLGVPTVDMDNICRCLEEKTGGKIIHRVGGVVYIFRGRNYDHRARPQLPVMLWRPAAPVYPKLIQEAPGGLTKEEADELRSKGKNLLPICKLAKNGVYTTLVRDVRVAFEGCALAKIDCKGMHASDYKKLGAKLKELVPCVLLSFDDEQILMWRGKDWKSMYRDIVPTINPRSGGKSTGLHKLGDPVAHYQESEAAKVRSSPKMISLWQRAVESGKALLLNEINLGPDDLLDQVEQFESSSQVTEHSYPALIISSKGGPGLSRTLSEDASWKEDFSEDEAESSDSYDKDNLNDLFEDIEGSSVPLGALPIDMISMGMSDNEESS